MQHQLEEANRQLTEANKQLKEAQNSLEIEESNRVALTELYAEWKAEGEAERQSLKQELEEAKTKQSQTSTSTPSTFDLSAKAGKIASYIKTLMADTRLLNSTLNNIKKNKLVELPKEAISKIEKILGGDDG